MPADSLVRAVGERLRATGRTIAIAESCTGGLIAAHLTAVAGSSEYMLGGVVSYADAVKRQVLGVDAQTLADDGAVSEAVAQQMADGVRRLLDADVALSVTGIAGPGGGSETKPVGLTFIGLSTSAGTWVQRFVFSGDRAQNREQAVAAALQFVLDELDGQL